jgi:hypothetical protein
MLDLPDKLPEIRRYPSPRQMAEQMADNKYPVMIRGYNYMHKPWYESDTTDTYAEVVAV